MEHIKNIGDIYLQFNFVDTNEFAYCSGILDLIRSYGYSRLADNAKRIARHQDDAYFVRIECNERIHINDDKRPIGLFINKDKISLKELRRIIRWMELDGVLKDCILIYWPKEEKT